MKISDVEIAMIKKEGIGSDCVGRTVLGGDVLTNAEDRRFTVVWHCHRWALEDAEGKRFALLCREQISQYKRVL